MHQLQTIHGANYQYDPTADVVFYGEAGAGDFTHDGVTYLAACGCAAEAGCQCRRTVYRAMYTPPDTPTKTPLAEVRAGVARVSREMAAEKEGRAVLRRVRNEAARDFEYLRQVPVTDGYSAALARLHGAEAKVDIYEDGPVPDGYSLALKKLGLPEPLPMVRDDDGIPLPYETALQCR